MFCAYCSLFTWYVLMYCMLLVSDHCLWTCNLLVFRVVHAHVEETGTLFKVSKNVFHVHTHIQSDWHLGSPCSRLPLCEDRRHWWMYLHVHTRPVYCRVCTCKTFLNVFYPHTKIPHFLGHVYQTYPVFCLNFVACVHVKHSSTGLWTRMPSMYSNYGQCDKDS